MAAHLKPMAEVEEVAKAETVIVPSFEPAMTKMIVLKKCAAVS